MIPNIAAVSVTLFLSNIFTKLSLMLLSLLSCPYCKLFTNKFKPEQTWRTFDRAWQHFYIALAFYLYIYINRQENERELEG